MDQMKLTRRLGTLMLAGAALTLVGCGGGASSDQGGDGSDKMGQLALPLVTQGASGVTYRLRDATFMVQGFNYGVGGSASGGGGGGSQTFTVSSETNPDAPSISLSLEEGSYQVQLLSGWHFEKEGPEGAQPVEVTLLSGESQWVWVSRQSTSFAEFEFGLGDRSLWLNGQLNIGVVLHEDPSELQGCGGSGGSGGSGYGYAGSGYTCGTGGSSGGIGGAAFGGGAGSSPSAGGSPSP